MNKINWKIRFSKENKVFLSRVFVSVFIPILVYYGLQVQDLTSWGAVFSLLGKAVSNPFVIGMAVINFINVIPDPTTKGFSDSANALTYTEANPDK